LHQRLLVHGVLICLVAGGGMFGAMMLYYTAAFPDPMGLRLKERAPLIRILARDGSVLAERGAAYAYMPYDLLPKRVIDAVVATEDRRFFEHWGLDPVGLLRAVFANLRAGRFAQGGSTLTQQLAKNIFLTPDRTLGRKLEELILALWLEMRLTKNEILELYLNRVYFGSGAYGIEAAAQRYFEKSSRELTLTEAAVIAGLLKAPSRYAPTSNPAQALTRSRSVLSKMADAGFISAEEALQASQEPVRFSEGPRDVGRQGVEYAIDYVLDELPQFAGVEHSEIIVETTFDAALQRRTSEIIARNIEKQGSALDVSQAAAIVLDADGGIRAIVGGRSYRDSQFNRVLKARRQPGSAMKPFVYLTALESGLTPDSEVYDLPLDVGGWSPRNDNGKYLGAVTLRQALSQSINTVAVRLLMEVGAGRVIETAQRLGISSELRRDASLALGTSEVTPLELTAAYGAFASSGRALEPYGIRRVRTGSGRVLHAREAPSARAAIARQHLSEINGMLKAVIDTGTGRRAQLPGREAAGKTGTSQDFRDAWFIGFTADLVAGVWAGNDDGHVMNRVVGGGLPALTWREIMLVAHEGIPARPLPGLGQMPESTQPADPPLTIASQARRETSSSMMEFLPWLTGKRSTEMASTPVSEPSAAATRFPAEQISDEFLARALGQGTLEASDKKLETLEETGVPIEGDRIIVRPPVGLMSLGRPPE
jgi:penicillin-binding protein 1A